jgi:hypothetical protein
MLSAGSAETGQIVKPFLLVEGRFDRNYVDDRYAFTMGGRLIKRLTGEPLPASQLVAVAPVSGDPFFVGNASAARPHRSTPAR